MNETDCSNHQGECPSPTDLTKRSTICECGWPEDSFACKIRHVQINTGDAKASKD